MAPRLDSDTSLVKGSSRAVTALGVVAPPPLLIEAPAFTGSLATLFRCVRDHRVDLLGVPLAPVCEAYFAYLMAREDVPLDEAAAALAALAYLLERKAVLLLPVEEEEDDAEEAVYDDGFALALPGVDGFGPAVEALRTWHEERSRLFFRQTDAREAYEVPFDLGDVKVSDLASALERVLRRAEPEPFTPLSKPRRSLQEMMSVVLRSLAREPKALEDLLPRPFTRTDVVYWFLALLELIRLGQAIARLDEETVTFGLAMGES